MVNLLVMVITSVIQLCPAGISFECRSWPGGVATKLSIVVVAADGSKNEGSTAEIGATASVKVVQDIFETLLEQDGWDVRSGLNDTVIVFAPKGQSVKSVKIESTGWEPVYKRVLGPPVVREQPKAKKP